MLLITMVIWWLPGMFLMSGLAKILASKIKLFHRKAFLQILNEKKKPTQLL